MPNRIEGDLQVTGRIYSGSLTVPAGSVSNAGVAADAEIAASKMTHYHYPIWSQPNTTATAETRTLHKAVAAGEVLSVWAGSIAKAVGDSTVTIDVKKNGTTILSSTIVLDNANTARVAEAGSISGTATYVAGDWFEAVITISAGTGTLPTGVAVGMKIEEDPA